VGLKGVRPNRVARCQKNHRSDAMQEESERAARVLFSFCSFLLRANEFHISFQTHAQVFGLALGLVLEAWLGDLFGANKKSGLGSLVRHGSRCNRKELEEEAVTRTMTSSAMPWFMFV
jgi:hypothetical protein